MRGVGPLGRGDFHPIYHPAGPDGDLAEAVDDVRIGHWVGMRDLLVKTGSDWALRTSRTQVLGAMAAGSTVVEAWRAEEPISADAVVMQARVAVERALQAHRERHHSVVHLEQRAREACVRAANYEPVDPVPWVCLLALAQVDERRLRDEHRQLPPEPMLPSGPWRLLGQICRRDQYNREGFHRMLQALYATGYRAHAFDFTRWAASWAPRGSSLLVMPLYAYAEHYWHRRAHGIRDPLMGRQWMREDVRPLILKAHHGWFEESEPATRSVLDMSHLAHALWASCQYAEAAAVFKAMGPFATSLPWAYVSGDPDRPNLAREEFVRARGQCLAAVS